jgi:hypothetical protein
MLDGEGQRELFSSCHSEPKAKNLTFAQGKLRVAIPKAKS